jgi:hypothetical protein
LLAVGAVTDLGNGSLTIYKAFCVVKTEVIMIAAFWEGAVFVGGIGK